LRLGGRFVVMVEYFADTPARTLGNFSCALGCADTDVLPGDHCAPANIRGSADGVKRGKVDRTFPYTFTRGFSTFGGALADVSPWPTSGPGEVWCGAEVSAGCGGGGAAWVF
jgi:hypothetical protein